MIIIGGHFGRDKTHQKITERFFWKTLWTDVQKYVQECATCQRTNDTKFQKSTASLHPIPVKSRVWNQVFSYFHSIYKINASVKSHTLMMTFCQVGIDLIGPLPQTARGNRYIVTLMDYFSKWPEAEPLPDKSAKSVALFLYKMMCRYI